MPEQTKNQKLEQIKRWVDTGQKLSPNDIDWLIAKADRTIELADLVAVVSKKLNTGMRAYRKNDIPTALTNFDECQDKITRSHYWRSQSGLD